MYRLGPGVVSEMQREALRSSVVLLIDDAFQALATSGGLEESAIASYLPPRLQRHYNEGLYRTLLVAVVDVGGQLAWTDTPSLRCVADELALHIIIEQADVWFETHDEDVPHWGVYEDAVFEDTDFDLLYRPEWDGVEDPDSDVAIEYGMANLHPSRWLEPFRHEHPVHPYLADEED